jgi:thiol-disulfide isomerase/thioredoxin
MTTKQLLFLAVSMALVALQAAAFLPNSHLPVDTRLMYRNYDDMTFSDVVAAAATPSSVATTAKHKITTKRHSDKSVTSPPKLNDFKVEIDVDADRMMSLSILLEPPAAPINEKRPTRLSSSHPPPPPSSRVTSTASRATTRVSPVTQLFNIQDYHQHVLNSPDHLCIIRFHAPWCQVCRTTNVSWDRMASKISQMNTSNRNIKFLSVTLDRENKEVEELKDMLQIQSVPQGIIHYASEGLFGQRLHLNRKNLGYLKKELESYLTNDMGADMFLYRLKKDL